MKLARLAVVLGVVFVSISVSACEASFSTASISDAWMSADEAGTQRVTSYPQDAAFYAQVEVSNAPDETPMKTSWTVVNVEGVDPGLVLDEVETAVGSGGLFFSLTRDGPWPVGDYKVDIYLNDEVAESLEFSVE